MPKANRISPRRSVAITRFMLKPPRAAPACGAAVGAALLASDMGYSFGLGKRYSVLAVQAEA
ncbi:hypothetical protein DLREEDagr8_09580 [Dongia sp. agr-C8]